MTGLDMTNRPPQLGQASISKPAMRLSSRAQEMWGSLDVEVVAVPRACGVGLPSRSNIGCCRPSFGRSGITLARSAERAASRP